MIKPVKLLYSPALRMKAGELEGLRLLSNDVAACILPRLIIPPCSERDEATSLPFELSRVPDIAPALAKAWRRPALIDSTYIIDEFGRDDLAHWLPPMFERVWKKGSRAIPAALLDDIKKSPNGFRACIPSSEPIKFGIIISSDQMVTSDFSETIAEALSSLNITASDCAVIVDFEEMEFEPEIVAPIIGGSLERLQEAGLWRNIIFQGSHYPDINPAPESEAVLCPRNEWLAWKLAVKFDPSTAEHMLFGDYAADCSTIEFRKGGGRAIRHVRYATPKSWRVERGAKHGKDSDSMHQVYVNIVRSSDFAGAAFSEADAFIARAASDPGAPHGSAKTWRQLNTTHHITQVVTDIAEVRGVVIRRVPVEASFQLTLLP